MSAKNRLQASALEVLTGPLHQGLASDCAQPPHRSLLARLQALLAAGKPTDRHDDRPRALLCVFAGKTGGLHIP